jgi:hypothetical protein
MVEFAPDERIYIVEDTPELRCDSPYKTQLYIRKDQAVLAIQTALRWTPKRIVFGELRSGEVAVELLEAWNTGHPGNFTTIHADNAASTIPRIEGLLRQIIKGKLPYLAESVQLTVHLVNKSGFGPSVNEVLTVREIQEEKLWLEIYFYSFWEASGAFKSGCGTERRDDCAVPVFIKSSNVVRYRSFMKKSQLKILFLFLLLAAAPSLTALIRTTKK